MAKLIPAAQRVAKAYELIQQARDLPAPEDKGWADFSYTARVRDLLRQAKELVKLIPYSPSASTEIKAEVKAIFKETEIAEKEILNRS